MKRVELILRYNTNFDVNKMMHDARRACINENRFEPSLLLCSPSAYRHIMEHKMRTYPNVGGSEKEQIYTLFQFKVVPDASLTHKDGHVIEIY